MLRSMYVIVKAYSKVGIKETAAQNWERLHAHQFNYTKPVSHSLSGINWQLPTHRAVKLWHSVTDKSSAMLSSHTQAGKKIEKRKKRCNYKQPSISSKQRQSGLSISNAGRKQTLHQPCKIQLWNQQNN